jgi:hypothetical protein
MERRLLLVLGAMLMSAIAVAETKNTATGPYCWAGGDENGKARFIPCHPEERPSVKDVDLDLAALSKLRIHIDNETITVSREQLLKALPEWRAAPRARL